MQGGVVRGGVMRGGMVVHRVNWVRTQKVIGERANWSQGATGKTHRIGVDRALVQLLPSGALPRPSRGLVCWDDPVGPDLGWGWGCRVQVKT